MTIDEVEVSIFLMPCFVRSLLSLPPPIDRHDAEILKKVMFKMITGLFDVRIGTVPIGGFHMVWICLNIGFWA